MNKKTLNQIIELRTAIKEMENDINLLTEYEDIQNYLNEFMKLYLQVANEKNNRPNKAIIGFIHYSKNKTQKNKIQKIQNKAKYKRLKHKSTYKDYIQEYIILRRRGHSYKSIAEYSLNYFKIKVSKETIRKAIKEVLNDD